ncbi:MAG TPA: hypothetical protein VM509_12080, partial [Planctomycetota bacterium]|nr:hypothetical protein [Planctomycetota bacterium]
TLGAVLFFAVNHLRFGSVLATGYPALPDGAWFAVPPHEGLAGLCVAPGRGLVWMAPLVLLAPFGLHAARARGERAWPALALFVTLAVVLPVLFFQTWHGAWTYGPRYVLPCLPLAWPAVALALDVARERRAVLVAAVLLTLLGFATSLPAVLVDPMTEQDLALQAARLEWPAVAGTSERERDDARFSRVQWSWRFAAPWAHWRIAAARARGADDVYSARELFGVDSDALLHPAHDRERGWRHLAWVDLDRRLAGPWWLGLVAAAICLAFAGFFAARMRERPGSGDPAL